MKPEHDTQSDDEYSYPEEHFIKADYDQLDQPSAANEENHWDLQFYQITRQ